MVDLGDFLPGHDVRKEDMRLGIGISVKALTPTGSFRKLRGDSISWPSGGMADARDLKSRGLNRSCGFESRLGYLLSAVVRSGQ